MLWVDEAGNDEVDSRMAVVMVMMTMITVILYHFMSFCWFWCRCWCWCTIVTYNTHNYHTDADNDEKVSYTKVLIAISMIFTPTSPRANTSSNQFPSTRALQLVWNFKTCDSNMPLVHTVHTSPQQLQHVATTYSYDIDLAPLLVFIVFHRFVLHHPWQFGSRISLVGRTLEQ